MVVGAVLLLGLNFYAQPGEQQIAKGAYMINMGSNPQTIENSLQPYMELTLNALIILYQNKALGDRRMYCIDRLAQTAPLVCQQGFQVESSNLRSHKRELFQKTQLL